MQQQFSAEIAGQHFPGNPTQLLLQQSPGSIMMAQSSTPSSVLLQPGNSFMTIVEHQRPKHKHQKHDIPSSPKYSPSKSEFLSHSLQSHPQPKLQPKTKTKHQPGQHYQQPQLQQQLLPQPQPQQQPKLLPQSHLHNQLWPAGQQPQQQLMQQQVFSAQPYIHSSPPFNMNSQTWSYASHNLHSTVYQPVGSQVVPSVNVQPDQYTSPISPHLLPQHQPHQYQKQHLSSSQSVRRHSTTSDEKNSFSPPNDLSYLAFQSYTDSSYALQQSDSPFPTIPQSLQPPFPTSIQPPIPFPTRTTTALHSSVTSSAYWQPLPASSAPTDEETNIYNHPINSSPDQLSPSTFKQESTLNKEAQLARKPYLSSNKPSLECDDLLSSSMPVSENLRELTILTDSEMLSDAAIQHALGEFRDSLDDDTSPVLDDEAMRKAWNTIEGNGSVGLSSLANILESPHTEWAFDTSEDLLPTSTNIINTDKLDVFACAKFGTPTQLFALLCDLEQTVNIQQNTTQDGLLHLAIQVSVNIFHILKRPY